MNYPIWNLCQTMFKTDNVYSWNSNGVYDELIYKYVIHNDDHHDFSNRLCLPIKVIRLRFVCVAVIHISTNKTLTFSNSMFLFKCKCKFVATMVRIQCGALSTYCCRKCRGRNFRLLILISINSYSFPYRVFIQMYI